MEGVTFFLYSFKAHYSPCAVRNLQDLARIYIRRTLRNFINDEMQAKGIPQKPPPKRKRRRYHRRRFSTYVFRGNQLIPEPLDSEEDERMEEDNRDDDDKDHNEALKPEEPPRNLLREKIMSLPLPESLKAYLTRQPFGAFFAECIEQTP
uniref:Protein-L-isoaspartate (D-aspartate) O-methyltransferase domain containing 1 n=1 Tax=Chelonoidis abingdonii TaxID=106734 RepID=A0A8C0IYM2_CHEAB